MKCDICGKEVDKLYECMFTDDPEDWFGYPLEVCEDCIPDEIVDYILDQEEKNGRNTDTKQ